MKARWMPSLKNRLSNWEALCLKDLTLRQKGIEIIRDYVTGKISLTELMAFAKQKYPPESSD